MTDEAGVGHIPEDRQHRGLVLDFSIAENIALHDYRHEPASRLGWLFPGRLIGGARSLISEFDIRGGGPTTRAGDLSGGNQQKVILAREISRDPRRPHRRAADPRPRRRRDRVRPPAADRRARRGPRDPARLARARGDPLALRPHPRHVRGPDRRPSSSPASRRRSSAWRWWAPRPPERAPHDRRTCPGPGPSRPDDGPTRAAELAGRYNARRHRRRRSSRPCSRSSWAGSSSLATGHNPLVDVPRDLQRHRAHVADPGARRPRHMRLPTSSRR